MDSHYVYLLVNGLTILFPFLLSFDRKVAFYRHWKRVIPAILITYVFMIVWDHYFSLAGIWWFSQEYTTGVMLYDLPIEEHLFFLTVPYACMFVYACIKAYFPVERLAKISIYINIAALIISVGMVILFHDRLYTAISFLCCSFLLFQHLFLIRSWKTYQGKFWEMYLVSMIPFAIVNGILTALPVVIYNNEENTGIRMGTIPMEDLSYHLFTMLSVVTLYEWFKRKPNQELEQRVSGEGADSAGVV